MAVEGIDCLLFFVCANDYAYVRNYINWFLWVWDLQWGNNCCICRSCSILFFLFRVACTDRLIRGNAEKPQGVMS